MNTSKKIGTALLLGSMLLGTFMSGAEIKLPGTLIEFVSYLKSFSASDENIVYYVDDTLLFEEMPSLDDISQVFLKGLTNWKQRHYNYIQARKAYKSALHMTFNYRLMRIIAAHREMKETLAKIHGDSTKPVSLDLNQPQELAEAALLLKIAGLVLYIDAKGSYRLVETYSPPDYEANHYYKMLGFNIWKLEKEFNKSQRLELQVKEFPVKIPWEFEFLHAVTGQAIDAETFAEIFTRDRRFQLFLGLLYRLTDTEITYIDNLEPGHGAWKKIYGSDRFLCGMFILSHALRIKDNRLLLPGDPNPNAAEFWRKSVGIDAQLSPLEFLEQLATKDDGKLNYFYTFSFFLPESSRQTLLFDFDHEKFRDIYYLVELDKKERITGLELPVLKNFGFFSMIYALETENGSIRFPGGGDSWAKALGIAPGAESAAPADQASEILKHILRTAKKNRGLERFLPIYCKFSNRPGLLTPDVIRAFYDNYPDYNVLIDYIERIPLENPQTALDLLSWAKSFDNPDIPRRDKEAIVGVVQCLLEILAQKAKFMPSAYPYDRLVNEIMAMPLSASSLYDNVFRFFTQNLGIELTGAGADDAFFNFLLPQDPVVTIYKQDYRLELAPLQKQEIARILESQAATNLAQLIHINRLLEELRTSTSEQEHKRIGKQLFDAFLLLHLIDEIPAELPLPLRNLLENHSGDRLFSGLHRLMEKKLKKASQPVIDNIIAKVKGESLLQELKHYLLTCLYAVTLKDSRFQVFLNSNFTRYHDFSWSGKSTPWNCGQVSTELRRVAGYHLEGGLSRLQITLANAFCDHVLGRETGYEVTQAIPIIYNHLDLYPYTDIQKGQQYNGLLIKFAEELVEKSAENPTLKGALLDQFGFITSGNRFRVIAAYLENPEPKENKRRLTPFFFSELQRVGEAFFKKEKFVDQFSCRQELEAYREPGLYRQAREELNRLGSIYYHTFGTLKPYRYNLFPQQLSHFFESHWTSAEMIDELKVKVAYISSLRQMPSQLLGSVILRYLYLAADLFFRGTRIDYNRTIYMYSVFNYLYLNQIYNDFRKNGVLRIK